MHSLAREGPNDKGRGGGRSSLPRGSSCRPHSFSRSARSGRTLMTQTSPTSAARPVAAGGIGDSREFLGLLVHILVHTGHSPKKLDEEFHEIISTMREPTRGLNPAYLNFVTALPEVLAGGSTVSRCHGPRGSAPPEIRRRRWLRSSDRCFPGEDPSAVVDSARLRGIRRRGNFYVPTDRQLRFDEQNVWAHALRALLGMLRTIDYNVRRATPDSTIYERAAVNLEFPVWALPAFHKWLKREARVFLWKVYTSMGRRASRRR